MKSLVYFFLWMGLMANGQKNASTSFDQLFFDGMTERLKNNYEKSNELFSQCLIIDPKNDVVYFKIAQNFFDMEQYRESEAYLENAKKLNPDNKWYQKLFIDLKIAQHASPKIVQKLIKDFTSTIHNKYIIEDLQRNFFQAYLTNGKKQINNLPEKPSHKSQFGKLWDEKAYQKIIEQANKNLEDEPDQATNYLWAAKAYTALKNYPAAEEFLNMGIDFAEQDKKTYQAFIKQYIRLYQLWNKPEKLKLYKIKLSRI